MNDMKWHKNVNITWKYWWYLKFQARSCVRSRATCSRLTLVCWRGLLSYFPLCCPVVYKYNFIGCDLLVISCFSLRCFRKADLSVAPTKFMQLQLFPRYIGTVRPKRLNKTNEKHQKSQCPGQHFSRVPSNDKSQEIYRLSKISQWLMLKSVSLLSVLHSGITLCGNTNFIKHVLNGILRNILTPPPAKQKLFTETWKSPSWLRALWRATEARMYS
jgi:hypothetical protein